MQRPQLLRAAAVAPCLDSPDEHCALVRPHRHQCTVARCREAQRNFRRLVRHGLSRRSDAVHDGAVLTVPRLPEGAGATHPPIERNSRAWLMLFRQMQSWTAAQARAVVQRLATNCPSVATESAVLLSAHTATAFTRQPRAWPRRVLRDVCSACASSVSQTRMSSEALSAACPSAMHEIFLSDSAAESHVAVAGYQHSTA